ncbi:MAG: DUF397 domain-containing protein, partial [Pseudonocardiaceae bacterium]
MRDRLPPAMWRKSTYSNDQGACVEVTDLGDGRAVRDSKDPTGPVLITSPAQWAAFTSALRDDIG